MRVLIVTYESVLGGAERLILDFGEGIDGEVIVACPPGPLAERAEASGFATRSLRPRARELRASLRDRVLAPMRLAGHAREIRAAVREVAPDVVIGWGTRSALAAVPAAGRPGRPPAFVFHHNDLLPGPLIGALVRGMSRRADSVIATSATIAADLDPAGRLAGRLKVVRPGVDLERFRPFDGPSKEPRALFLGAIQQWKRPDLALEIVARAARDLPGLRLSMVGAPIDRAGESLLSQLRARAKRPDLDGRVEFIGWTQDAPAVLADATCLLHCADREPLGMVVMEALACGRAVVAPASGGPQELLHDQVGRLYPPGDAKAGAEALIAVAGSPEAAARLGAAARRTAEAEFDRTAARLHFVKTLAELVNLS